MTSFYNSNAADPAVIEPGTPLDLVPATTANTAIVTVVPPKQPKIDRTTAYNPPQGLEKAHNMLLDMLSYKRPARSKAERAFINRFIIPLKVEVDKYGNFYKKIGTSAVLWSCHVDTVHDDSGKQVIGFDMDEIGIAEKGKSNCLGGDDTCGVWLMVQMILANVPGLYIFHREEEVGRKGSEFIAKYMSSHLKPIRFAIALDRKGDTSIITHQMGKRCCSDEFTKSLAEQLGMGYKADDTGSYTDTASYVGLIGECTNLSVGFRNAHQATERIDRAHMFKLREKLLTIDESKLANVRVAGTTEYKSYSVGTTYSNGMAYSYGQGEDDYTWAETGHWEGGKWVPPLKKGTGLDFGGHANSYGKRLGSNSREAVVYGTPVDKLVKDDDDEPTGNVADIQKDYDMMVKLIVKNAEAVADILEQYGYGYDELSSEIMQTGAIRT